MHELQILPPKKKEVKPFKHKIHDNLLEPDFNILLIAPTSGGKSTIILNLLKNDNFYSKAFDKIYYFSPSIMQDKTLTAIANDEDIIKIYEDEDLMQADKFLKVIIEDQKEQIKKDPDDIKHILIVYDDMLSYMKTSSLIGTLYTKSRHYNISCCITSQNYKSIPLKARNNSQMILISKLYNHSEYDKIQDEIGCNFKDFDKYYNEAIKERYGFLYCDLRNMRLFKNFHELIWSKERDY